MKQSIQFINGSRLSSRNNIDADLFGAIAISICMRHFIAMSFLFFAQTCSAFCCDASTTWGRWLDYAFLLISFFAAWQSSKTPSKDGVKYALWLSWGLLLTTILDEKQELIAIPEGTIYFPASALIGLNFYNLKYCHCRAVG